MTDIDPFAVALAEDDPFAVKPTPRPTKPIKRHVLDDPFSDDLTLPFVAVGRARIGSMELVVVKVDYAGSTVLHRFHADQRQAAQDAGAFAAGSRNMVLLDGIQPASTMIAIETGIRLGIAWAGQKSTRH